jgi:tetratricopeptide (TPR) repeat protein
MNGKRKISKKKLKEPDEFITFTEKSILFLKGHLKTILSFAIIILIVIASLYFYFKWEESKEIKAQKRFNLAMKSYEIASSSNDDNSLKEYKNALEKFNEIISKFPKTSTGKLSILYKGNIHLKLGEFEEAIKSYQDFLKKGVKEKLYRIFALEGLGFAYEGKKDFKNAIEAFNKIIEIGEPFETAEAYLHLARCEERLGRSKEAVENYKKFLSISQKSYKNDLIIKKISNLEK